MAGARPQRSLRADRKTAGLHSALTGRLLRLVLLAGSVFRVASRLAFFFGELCGCTGRAGGRGGLRLLGLGGFSRGEPGFLRRPTLVRLGRLARLRRGPAPRLLGFVDRGLGLELGESLPARVLRRRAALI